MQFQSVDQIFNKFNDLRVLIIGDVMVDTYVWGKVNRISPEAPVPIVSINKKENRLGGAANVALNVQALGATPVLCSVIGEDVDGQTFIELLNSRGISTEGIIKSNQRITSVKERVLSGSQHMLRIDREIEKELNELDQELLIEKYKHLLEKSDVVIFQDYDKGVLNEDIIRITVDYAKKENIPTVVDPKRKNFLCYKNVTLFKPNLKEIKEGIKIDFDENDKHQLEEAVQILKQKMNIRNALITLSEKGVYIDGEDEKHHIPAHIRSISDVSGAGDTVVSIASLCLALKLPVKFTAALSNIGGGLVCEYLGVVPVDKEKLKQEVLKNGLL